MPENITATSGLFGSYTSILESHDYIMN
eukprot:COSAG02_NODE_56195_length_286_cov_1.443850_1_plen_27_part_10